MEIQTSLAQPHSFHIPVMGLGYTIDTPLKVAHFGIDSVVSIIEDELVERMREHHCKLAGEPYEAIPKKEVDHRARRITAYLDLLQRIVRRNTERLRGEAFTPGSDIAKYFELLADGHPLRRQYEAMTAMPTGPARDAAEAELRKAIRPGSIDVNIMAKIDRTVHAKDGTPLPAEYAEGMAAFRGFALSQLDSSIVMSAGYNPRIYAYIASFPDFFPGADGKPRKKIILKVSDLRSAMVQGRILAKKGIWTSEFRIESGLNCGGHAFATDGLLMGPILEEFKRQRTPMSEELRTVCNKALAEAGRPQLHAGSTIRISVQGGIGTAEEDGFLREHYGMDATGWGSPFLLVPEVTNVDDATLQGLRQARPEDYYMSWASPLGIPFHNFRRSSAEAQRKARIDKGRPGSPCYKEFLSTDTEFTAIPICTASRQYQDLKLKQLQAQGLSAEGYGQAAEKIMEKDCLCEGLGAGVLMKNGMRPAHKLEAVAICPGPNLAWFSRVVSLRTMVDHIHGRLSLLNTTERPHMFINELKLYVDYLRREAGQLSHDASDRQRRHVEAFKANLLQGIRYYEELAPVIHRKAMDQVQRFKEQLQRHAEELRGMLVPEVVVG
jgi:hypothetical protein